MAELFNLPQKVADGRRTRPQRIAVMHAHERGIRERASHARMSEPVGFHPREIPAEAGDVGRREVVI
jgi:hypothetical protein